MEIQTSLIKSFDPGQSDLCSSSDHDVESGGTSLTPRMLAALACTAANLSVIPIDPQTGRPAAWLLPTDETGEPNWEPYQIQIADEATLARWFADGRADVAVVTGTGSNGLLIIDFAVRSFYENWCRHVGDLADDLPIRRTVEGGYQIWLRCPKPGRNQTLAWAIDETSETGYAVAIGTRGEGGYVVVASSINPSRTHDEMLDWDLSCIPKAAPERAGNLLQAARELDEAPKARQQLEAGASIDEGQRTGMNGEANDVEVNHPIPIEHAVGAAAQPLGTNSIRSGQPLPGKAIPGSRCIEGSGTRNDQDPGTPLIEVWQQREPGRRPSLVEGLIYKAINTLYGDAAQGKSLIATLIGLHVVLGRPFASLAVEQGPVLFIDAELDDQEFTRRAYKLSRGLELSGPPEGLYYWQLPGSLSDPKIQAQVAAQIQACTATLVILDSLTIATYGSDARNASDMISVLRHIESWGVAVIVIDHIAKPAAGTNASRSRPFGSAFKFNLARSVIQVVQAEGGGVSLRQTKNNFDKKAAPVNLALEFGDDIVQITVVDAADECMSGIGAHLPALEQVAHALAQYPDGVPPADLAADVGMSVKTIRNHLTVLKKQERGEPVGDGRWRPIPDSRLMQAAGMSLTPSY